MPTTSHCGKRRRADGATHYLKVHCVCHFESGLATRAHTDTLATRTPRLADGAKRTSCCPGPQGAGPPSPWPGALFRAIGASIMARHPATRQRTLAKATPSAAAWFWRQALLLLYGGARLGRFRGWRRLFADTCGGFKLPTSAQPPDPAERLALSASEKGVMRAAVSGRAPPLTVLVTCDATNQSLTLKDLRTVTGRRCWLNDEVVNLYLHLVAQHYTALGCKVHAMSSFFYAKLAGDSGVYTYTAVQRWTKRVDLFAQDLVLVPINHGNTHWTLVAIKPTARAVLFFDSSRGDDARRVLQHLVTYLRDEHAAKRDAALDVTHWTAVSVRDGAPRQNDGCSCGVFALSTAAVLAAHVARGKLRGRPGGEDRAVLPYTQAHMPALRARIAVDLLTLRHTALS